MNPHMYLPLIMMACFGINIILTVMQLRDKKKGVSRRWLRVLIPVLYALACICAFANVHLYFNEVL